MKYSLTRRILILILFLAAGKLSFPQVAADARDDQGIERIFGGKSEICFTFSVDDRSQLEQLSRILSVDHVKGNQVRAYANRKEFSRFLELGYPYTVLPAPASMFPAKMADYSEIPELPAWDFYPTYSAYVAMMFQFEADHPDLCRIISIGTLPSGRELLVAKITSNIDSSMNKPQFLYTSSMHGDELTGYVMMLRLIDLLLSGYDSSAYLTNLVDNIEIYINPLANPDGTFAGGNNTVNGATRYNADGVDLNRNYPDPVGGPHPDGNPWQPETVFFMEFAADKHFVMGGNFHGGAEVVNYPFDTWATLPADNDWWYYVSRQFADTIHAYAPASFFNDLDNGVTNGYAWYSVQGGRQDYMNYWHHCREATLEISNTKTPAASQLPTFWNRMYRSFLYYLEQSTFGIRGIVTDSVTGEPLRAKVFIQGHDFDSSEVYSALPVGNYHRLLYTGTYDLTFTAPGYFPKTVINLQVVNANATLADVQLVPVWTGITGSLPGNRFPVYPNPAASSLEVRPEGDPGSCQLKLTNILGETVYAEALTFVPGNPVTVDVSNYPSGIYILEIGNGKPGAAQHKVVIAR